MNQFPKFRISKDLCNKTTYTWQRTFPHELVVYGTTIHPQGTRSVNKSLRTISLGSQGLSNDEL